MSGRRSGGYAGLVGASFFLLAILSVNWAVIDPAFQWDWWLTYFAILMGSTLFAALYGFTLRDPRRSGRHYDFLREIRDTVLGIVFGAIIVSLQFLIMFIDTSFSFGTPDSVWLTLLAPVSEAMLFDVAIFDFADWYAEGIDWRQVSLVSDVTFVGYHYVRYFDGNTDIIRMVLIAIILAFGNTLFVWGYAKTRNATVPIVSHFIVNLASQKVQVLQAIIDASPVIVWLLIIAIVAYFILFKIIWRR